MVIYEVNLFVNSEIYPLFETWLKGHIEDMLKFPGFIQASILKPENETLLDKEIITVQYQIKNREELESYFEKHSAKMRDEGLNLFRDKFTVHRRIYEVKETISKKIVSNMQ